VCILCAVSCVINDDDDDKDGSITKMIKTRQADVPGALKTREWTTRHEMTRVDKAGVDNARVETRDRLIRQKAITDKQVHGIKLTAVVAMTSVRLFETYDHGERI